MAKIELIFSADFFQETPDFKLSGNLDLGLFSQTSAEKPISYLSWKFRYYSFVAKIELIFSAVFFQETPDLKLSGNSDLGLFPQISAGKLRLYAFWKFRSYSSTSNFPRETSDLTLPGNLDLIPF